MFSLCRLLGSSSSGVCDSRWALGNHSMAMTFIHPSTLALPKPNQPQMQTAWAWSTPLPFVSKHASGCPLKPRSPQKVSFSFPNRNALASSQALLCSYRGRREASWKMTIGGTANNMISICLCRGHLAQIIFPLATMKIIINNRALFLINSVAPTCHTLRYLPNNL